MSNGLTHYVNYLKFLHVNEKRAWLKKSAALLRLCDIACDILLDFFHHNVKVVDEHLSLGVVDETWYDALRDVQDSFNDIGANFFRAFKRRTEISKKIEKIVKTVARATEQTINLNVKPEFDELKGGIKACQKFTRKLLTRKREKKSKPEKEPKEPKNEKEPKEPKREKEPKEPKNEKEPKEPKSEKEPKEPKREKEPKEPKEPKPEVAAEQAKTSSQTSKVRNI